MQTVQVVTASEPGESVVSEDMIMGDNRPDHNQSKLNLGAKQRHASSVPDDTAAARRGDRVEHDVKNQGQALPKTAFPQSATSSAKGTVSTAKRKHAPANNMQTSTTTSTYKKTKQPELTTNKRGP